MYLNCLGGLLFKEGGSNLQHSTALSFLFLVYARYTSSIKNTIRFGNVIVKPTKLADFAKRQVCI